MSQIQPTQPRLEKRGSRREPTRASFHIEVTPTTIEGAGRDLSDSGASLITSDALKVRVRIRDEFGEEREVDARIVRIESVTEESWGIALQFDGP